MIFTSNSHTVFTLPHDPEDSLIVSVIFREIQPLITTYGYGQKSSGKISFCVW